MDEAPVKFEGWKSRRMGDVFHFKCPYCGGCFESYGNNTCPKCRKIIQRSELKEIFLKKTIVTCSACGAETPLTPERLDLVGGYSYLYRACQNNVAIRFKSNILKPQTVVDLKWNKDIKDRALPVANNLFFSACTSEKDYLILKILQRMAKDEESFFYIRPETQKAGLMFNVEQNRYLGFVVWTEEKHAILRQIFIREDERKRGFGTKLLKFWVETFADKINEKFGVESPKELSRKMLVSLRYAKVEGQGIKWGKCFFVPSGC